MLDVSVFLLKSFGCDKILLLFSWSRSQAEFFFKNNGPLKGQVFNFPSCCINNYLMPLLLIPHPSQSYFRYGINGIR